MILSPQRRFAIWMPTRHAVPAPSRRPQRFVVQDQISPKQRGAHGSLWMPVRSRYVEPVAEAETDIFQTLHESIEARIESDNYFSDAAASTPVPIPVLTEHKGDLENRIQRAINNIGMSCLVLTPNILPGNRPNSIIVEIAIGVFDNVIIRQSVHPTKSSIGACMKILATLWNYTPDANIWSKFKFGGMSIIETTPLVNWEIKFTTTALVSVTVE